jgi:hypothetical protein
LPGAGATPIEDRGPRTPKHRRILQLARGTSDPYRGSGAPDPNTSRDFEVCSGYERPLSRIGDPGPQNIEGFRGPLGARPRTPDQAGRLRGPAFTSFTSFTWTPGPGGRETPRTSRHFLHFVHLVHQVWCGTMPPSRIRTFPRARAQVNKVNEVNGPGEKTLPPSRIRTFPRARAQVNEVNEVNGQLESPGGVREAMVARAPAKLVVNHAVSRRPGQIPRNLRSFARAPAKLFVNHGLCTGPVRFLVISGASRGHQPNSS